MYEYLSIFCRLLNILPKIKHAPSDLMGLRRKFNFFKGLLDNNTRANWKAPLEARKILDYSRNI